jgi:hypothetical protein
MLALFLPGLMALSAWRLRFRRLAATSGRAPAILVLRNAFNSNAAQAIRVDAARREPGLIASPGDSAAGSRDALVNMRANRRSSPFIRAGCRIRPAPYGCTRSTRTATSDW